MPSYLRLPLDWRNTFVGLCGAVVYDIENSMVGMIASHVWSRDVEEERDSSTGQQVQLRTLRYA